MVRKGGSLIYRRRKGPVIGAERITNKMEYSTGSGPAVSAGPGVICCVRVAAFVGTVSAFILRRTKW